jgi:uncharacterized protein
VPARHQESLGSELAEDLFILTSLNAKLARSTPARTKSPGNSTWPRGQILIQSLAPGATVAYIPDMSHRPRSRSELLAILHAHEAELRARGVEALTVFGSFARDEETSASDVDLAVRPGAGFSSGGFDHFGRLEALRRRLSELLGCDVDLVEEPAARPHLREMIAQEGVRAF